MLDRDILIPHRLRLVLRFDEALVEVRPDVGLAAAHLDLRVDRRGHGVCKLFRIDPHLLNELQDQRILLLYEAVEKVLLGDLLIAEIIRSLLEVLDSLDGFLCKFLNIHLEPPSDLLP